MPFSGKQRGPRPSLAYMKARTFSLDQKLMMMRLVAGEPFRLNLCQGFIPSPKWR